MTAKKSSFATLFFALFAGNVYAWHTEPFRATHHQITTDVIADLNLAYYPDLQKFREQVQDGTEEESHNIGPVCLPEPGQRR